ncbi:class I SAM-dependent methyltransferase [Stackebrandtia nassauensis]|uniref:Methyltransferase type 12 n=1 Tax=Stackebrandtia nassauensis (strain DSM 44728 / CIP 108903 / NRRL B-16338 / NBRC 102104 / LLR-40K-21) TaxID=446470 RepID=D3Q2B3_STANL|nr:class I SAM-dependent methyltransferase [Stackebrandtia nassauensis]ADD43846.1 Methyltransferase type 12 [Stackebrandtia nassauensis DSM 44728]
MSNDGFVWSAEASDLAKAAQSDGEFYRLMAAELLRPDDRLAVDFGCGGGGMALALRDRAAETGQATRVVGLDAHEEVFTTVAADNPDLGFAVASFEDSPEQLRAAAGGAPDLVWARGALHHADDEQVALRTLAEVLADGGVIALAEGGTTAACLPNYLGIGKPGLDKRLNAAADEAARRRMADLKPMPYGWLTGLRNAGFIDVTTRNILFDKPAPLEGADLDHVLRKFAKQIEWSEDLLSPEDLECWRRLLDPDDPVWLGLRDDLFYLAAQSVHIGRKP